MMSAHKNHAWQIMFSVYGATAADCVNGDDQDKCGWTRVQCPVVHAGLVLKWYKPLQLDQSELMDRVFLHSFDLVFISKEVTSNGLSSSLHLFVFQDTFWLHSVASHPRTHSSVRPLLMCTELLCFLITSWALFLSLSPSRLKDLCFCLQMFNWLTSSPPPSLHRTRKLQIRNIPPHLQWEVSSYFLCQFSCWDHLRSVTVTSNCQQPHHIPAQFHSHGVKCQRFVTALGVWYWRSEASCSICMKPTRNTHVHPGDRSSCPVWNQNSTLIYFKLH